MGFLTNVFFLISTALLIPCMLALLWYLGRSLMLVGQTLREYWARRRVSGILARFSEVLEGDGAVLPELPEEGILAAGLARLRPVADNPILAERIVRQTELAWKADLERLRSLARNGPAFGLMGTLIPLGPALVGLAAGDLQTLSNNLIIAFATTVVGLLVAILAGTLASLKKHWYEADAILLHFAGERLAQLGQAGQPLACSCRTGTNGQTVLPVNRPVSTALADQGELLVAHQKEEDQ